MLKKKISTSTDYIFIRNTSLQVVSSGTFGGFTSTPQEMGNQSQDHCRTTQIQTLSNDMAFLRSWMLGGASLTSISMWLF